MRSTAALTALAVLALVCQGQPCAAQTTPPDKSAAPQTLTGPGGSDERKAQNSLAPPGKPEGAVAQTSAPPKDFKGPEPARDMAAQKKDMPAKKKEAVSGAEAGRVGTLSPDEERRAVRARERATSAAKAAPVHAAENEHDRKASPPLSPPRAKTMAPHRPVAVATGNSRPAQKGASVAEARPSDRGARTPETQARGPHRAATVATANGRPAQKRARAAEARPFDRGTRAPESERRRTAAGGDAFHARVRREAAPARGELAGDPGRVPRVGDVIPADVPLAPLPPGYDPRAGNDESAMDAPRRGWRYMTRPGSPPDFPDW